MSYVECPDLPANCDGLSSCCDRNFGTLLKGSKCLNTDFCDPYYNDFVSCTCTSYFKIGPLIGIIIAVFAVIILAIVGFIIIRRRRQASANVPPSQYAQGTPQNTQGAPKYTQGTPQYTQGTPQYTQGTPQYVQGTPQYSQGTPQY